MEKYINDILEEINRRIPDNCTANYQQVKKNNGVLLDGIIIKDENDIAPIFYVTEKDRNEFTPIQIGKQIADQFYREKERGIDFDVANFKDFEWVKERMMFDIVNRKRNKDNNWANIPITDDLMITFKISVMPGGTIRVTNDHLRLWGNKTPEELIEDARQNTVVADKAVFKSISEVIIDMMVNEYKSQYPNVPEDEFRERIRKEMLSGIDGMVFVLTTQQNSNAAMLYPDMLESIRKQLDDNLIILPSSTHEVLIMREADMLTMGGLENIKAMVREVNRDVVMQDNASDYLSDEILRYDGELRQITEDSQNKDEIDF